MKNSIYLLAASLLCGATSLLVSASPGFAQDARYKFAPNSFLNDQSTGRRHHSNPMPAPSTSVTTGNVPSATSLLGFNPKLLASAPRTYVNTNINMAPAAVPQFYSAPPVLSARSHQLFGQPAQPTPIRATVPAAVNRAPQVVAVNNVSGKLSTPLRSARSGSMAPQFRKPKQVNSAPPKIAKYGEHLYSPGATKPTSSEIYSTSEVNGKMLPINKRVN